MEERRTVKSKVKNPTLETEGSGTWLAASALPLRHPPDMGPRPLDKTLDRIDVQGHYEPGNCRWADDDTQGRNQRRFLFPNGNESPVADVPMDLDAEFAIV